MSLLQILWIRVFLLLLGRTLWCFAEITYIEVRLPLPGERAVPGSPWPAPQNWNTSNRQLILDPDTFYVTSNADTCDVIAKAMGRYRNIIFLNSKPICKEDVRSPLPGLHVVVDRFKDEHCQYPRHGQNETYTLEVPDEGEAVLKSQTVWGALRGLETFSQLVYEEDKTGKDAMAYNKFNVLHWHIVDDQSWPLELRTFPNLTESAFSRRYVYSKADVQDIVEYARLRGIRVIPEIDTPGHTQALGKIFPDLLTPCYGNGTRGTPNYPKHAAFEMLDPTKNITYDVVNEILKEVADTFKDEYLHLGMDEVSYDCWKSSPEIKEFMEQHCMSDVNEVEQYYIRRTFEKLEGSGSKLMIWQDPIDNDVQVPEGTLVGVWKNSSLCAEVNNWREHVSRTVRKGYQVVLSACWYLNYISYGEDWKRYYQCDPTSFEGTQREKDLVVGGEATVWGEYIDGNNLIPTLWPRACAVAERLWSSVSFNNTDDASFRLDQQRCRMVRRGISAQPILNGFCSD
ncbi:beta-hexosaminidase subunit beta-like isoform X3 [Ornithodoros turicata]|uniref:beta-hexosaminidase subunit beta-like isoform X3 n=1 Tax=Ornithodoros turicata TaxID=34597 RepID=UPI0031388A40